MEGLGNDFVVLEDDVPDVDLVRRLCDRRFGVGADGVLHVDSTPTMRYWNADGSVSEMCGNGLRCVARYAVDRGWASTGEWITIVTAVGERSALVEDDDITVGLGRVVIGGTLTVGERTYHEASVGNPHAVTLVADPDLVDVAEEGSLVSADPAFPDGVNVEFVTVEGPDRLRMRVWERGVGETLACGSGIVAAAAVALGTRPETITVAVPGGTARVFFDDGIGYLVGPAVTVFVGDWAPLSADV